MSTHISINDDTLVNMQEVFDCIFNYKYEEAFLISSMLMERNMGGDQLFHEWVKSLTEFYSCNEHDTAIALLETIKPKEIENIIHFRIINSLMCFYAEIKSEENFIKYSDEIQSSLHKLSNRNELYARILGNIANGYQIFSHYEQALEYSTQAIKTYQHNHLFNIHFTVTNMVRILSLFYLGKEIEAQEEERNLKFFLKLTNNLDKMKYLEKDLQKFYKEVNGH